MRIVRLLLTCAALLVLGACGEDEPDPQIEAGGCVSTDGDSIVPVLCTSDEADSRLIVQIAEGYPCPDGLTSLTYAQTLDGRDVGLPQRWCVAEPGAELTREQQEYLDGEKAKG
jgi:hypothetical protein